MRNALFLMGANVCPIPQCKDSIVKVMASFYAYDVLTEAKLLWSKFQETEQLEPLQVVLGSLRSRRLVTAASTQGCSDFHLQNDPVDQL